MPSAMWESAQLAMGWEWEELGRSVSKNRCVSTSACLGEMFSGCTLTLLMLKSACTDTCSWNNSTYFVATCWHLSACPEHPQEISSCSYNSAGAEEHWDACEIPGSCLHCKTGSSRCRWFREVAAAPFASPSPLMSSRSPWLKCGVKGLCWDSWAWMTR